MSGVSAHTSSRCVTESETGTHVVDNYSLLAGHIGSGQCVTSARFVVGGYHWFISFYPDGSTDSYYGQATSVMLRPCNGLPAGSVRVKCAFSLVDRDGNASFVGPGRAHELVSTCSIYAESQPAWGRHWFFWKPLLRFSRCLNNDCLTIRCVLTVINPLSAKELMPMAFEPPDLVADLERALKDGTNTDATFQVGSRVFRAHKFMLAARSPVFKAELFGPMMEKDMHHAEVVDMEPSIFEMLLHFIYTGSLPGYGEGYTVAAWQHLLVAADRYGPDKLKVMCEVYLCKGIDMKTITSTLALAEQHYCACLKDACLAYITRKNCAATRRACVVKFRF